MKHTFVYNADSLFRLQPTCNHELKPLSLRTNYEKANLLAIARTETKRNIYSKSWQQHDVHASSDALA